MTHGGPREGAGRPPVAPELRKVQVAYRLPQWLVDWIREQEEPASVLIEGALRHIHHLNPPK